MQANPKTPTPRPGRPPFGNEPQGGDRDPTSLALGARRRDTRWWWTVVCLVAAIGLAAAILVRFGWAIWTAALLAILLSCPLTLVWGVIQSLRRAPLVVGPVPETRGITIDWLAPVYDPMCGVMGFGLAMRRRTLAVAELKRGERVLDVGCGTGVLTRLAAAAVGPEGSAAGIDPGPAMIGVARLKAARAHSRATFELGVIERLAFGDDAFDVALSSFMLHHLPADVKRAGLGEVWRVLKAGGRLVLVDFDTTRPIARLMFAILGLVPTYARVLHGAGDPAPLLRAAGFVDVVVAGTWLGAATSWVARKPVVVPTPIRPGGGFDEFAGASGGKGVTLSASGTRAGTRSAPAGADADRRHGDLRQLFPAAGRRSLSDRSPDHASRPGNSSKGGVHL
jgi:ubiquinone/menaquinone biosynthesis C-methylase UbiE